MGATLRHQTPEQYPQQKNWYVLYVKSRAEKKVCERLEKKKMEVFLPLMKTKRKWSDRIKTIQVPLFSGYMFVHITPADFTEVKMIEGVVDFVKLENRYAFVPDFQIELIRNFIATGLHMSTSSDEFMMGEKVRINFGPLKNCEGELIRIKNEKQFLIRIDAIHQVLIVNVPIQHLSKI